MSWKSEVEEIERRRRIANEHGGEQSVQRQHGRGRMVVRERVEAFSDAASFREHGQIAGHAEAKPEKTGAAGSIDSNFVPANYVVGLARVDGRRVAIGGEDFTQRGGSPTPAGLRKSVYAEELALRYRVPLVRFLEGGGGSVAGSSGKAPRTSGEPVFARPRFESVMKAMATVPVASAALGAVAGLPAARLAASHFSVMTRETSQVLIAGPAVVERALGERKTKEELGGPQVHLYSGVVDNLAEDESDAFVQIRKFLSYLPTNVWERTPRLVCEDSPDRREQRLLEIVPRDRKLAYDAREMVALIVDRDSFFEIAPHYGPSQITGFARLDGRAVGILANDSRYFAGAMSAQGGQAVRKFVDLCDSFHLPIISFVDEPGFMIGMEAEQAGTIRYGAAAIFAVMQSRVPWASVIVRKAYGVAAAAHFGPDSYVLSWPSAETGALPIEGGVAVAFRREIADAANPDAHRKELEERFAASRTPFPRAESFSVHDLIDPRETRPALCEWLEWVDPLLDADLGPRTYTMRP